MTQESGGKSVLHKKHIARLERERRQRRIVLYAFIGILVTVVLLIGYGILDLKYLQLQKPVAKVGDVEILVNQFQPRVRVQRQQLLSQYGMYQQYAQLFGMDVQNQVAQIQSQLDNSETLGQTILNQMIDEQLVRLEAKKRGITLSEAELEKAKEDTFGYYPNGTPTLIPTATEIVMPTIPAVAYDLVTMTPLPSATPTAEFTATPTATLEPQPTVAAGPTSTPEPTATPYTKQGFEERLNESKDSFMKQGLAEKDYMGLFEYQLLLEKLKDQITADVPHTETQVWARHILVDDEATALNIVEQLKGGADFGELAKKYSKDTASATNGGDLGWFAKGRMVAEFEDAAFALKNPGDYTTTPAKSSFGYHIIQLIAKQDRPLTADQYAAAKEKVFSDWLTKAREDYNVQEFDIWKQYVPTEPNFDTAATEAVNAQNTAQAEAAKATATPAP
jgi:parvulin-like peptidyl-prolyl isomerase